MPCCPLGHTGEVLVGSGGRAAASLEVRRQGKDWEDIRENPSGLEHLKKIDTGSWDWLWRLS